MSRVPDGSRAAASGPSVSDEMRNSLSRSSDPEGGPSGYHYKGIPLDFNRESKRLNKLHNYPKTGSPYANGAPKESTSKPILASPPAGDRRGHSKKKVSWPDRAGKGKLEEFNPDERGSTVDEPSRVSVSESETASLKTGTQRAGDKPRRAEEDEGGNDGFCRQCDDCAIA